mmetsp:Transcript_12530/g.16556  ORF Transcript_12530/g.16556 Transcript_12530/m.16556 type:complete len:244 (-) Transcript_12530:686-1417(-)
MGDGAVRASRERVHEIKRHLEVGSGVGGREWLVEIVDELVSVIHVCPPQIFVVLLLLPRKEYWVHIPPRLRGLHALDVRNYFGIFVTEVLSVWFFVRWLDDLLSEQPVVVTSIFEPALHDSVVRELLHHSHRPVPSSCSPVGSQRFIVTVLLGEPLGVWNEHRLVELSLIGRIIRKCHRLGPPVATDVELHEIVDGVEFEEDGLRLGVFICLRQQSRALHEDLTVLRAVLELMCDLDHMLRPP